VNKNSMSVRQSTSATMNSCEQAMLNLPLKRLIRGSIASIFILAQACAMNEIAAPEKISNTLETCANPAPNHANFLTRNRLNNLCRKQTEADHSGLSTDPFMDAGGTMLSLMFTVNSELTSKPIHINQHSRIQLCKILKNLHSTQSKPPACRGTEKIPG